MTNFETAINDDFDSRLIEILYSVDHCEDIKGIHMGVVHNGSHEHDTGGIEHRVARLIEEVGPQGIKWPQLLLGGGAVGGLTDRRMQFDEQDKRYFELHGIPLGKYLSQLVFDTLPIEWSTEGDATVKVSLAMDNDYVLDLIGRGNFDTAYTYDHEGADMDIDDPSDSEIIYEMIFTADMFYCPNPVTDE